MFLCLLNFPLEGRKGSEDYNTKVNIRRKISKGKTDLFYTVCETIYQLLVATAVKYFPL